VVRTSGADSGGPIHFDPCIFGVLALLLATAALPYIQPASNAGTMLMPDYCGYPSRL